MKIERNHPGELIMIFSGLSNRNSQKCSTSLGKKKEKTRTGMILMPVTGKSKGVEEAASIQGPQQWHSLRGCKMSRGGPTLTLFLYMGSRRKGPNPS